MKTNGDKYVIDDLLGIMARLRDPESGCPWDLKQDFSTIAPFTIEEAYEVADAIARNDMHELREELGDLLFQVAFYTQMGREQGDFDFDDVVAGICEKMLRRHPHVFDNAEFENDEALHDAWEAEKKRERADKGKDESVLDGVALTLPALTRAQKLQRRAARVGFDWPDIEGVYDKCDEEMQELREATEPGHIAEEIGDLLFSIVNLARHYDVEPEEALRQANRKFETRFRQVEQATEAKGKRMQDCSLEELDAAWDYAKDKDRAG